MSTGQLNDLSVKKPKRTKSAPVIRVSISDVADLATVSIATVSRVLNTPNLVSPDTAQRVTDAIRQLDYRPNRFAKGLASKRSKLLGISLPDLHGEFFSELLRSADRHAATLGYNLIIGSSTHGVLGDPDYDHSVSGLIDGLVTMVTETAMSDLAHLDHFRVPIVVISTATNGTPAGAVTLDQSIGTEQAVAHLVSSTPPDRCFLVAGHRGNTDSDARTHAFIEALIAHGHTPEPGQIAHGEYSVEWGTEWATRMLKLDKLAGSAVLAGNDEIAVGVIDAARDAGLSVPGDVRVVGFDDTRLCTMFRPTLSSVSVPIAQAAQAAIESLIHRVEQPDQPRPGVRLSTTLVVRQSSQAPSRG